MSHTCQRATKAYSSVKAGTSINAKAAITLMRFAARSLSKDFRKFEISQEPCVCVCACACVTMHHHPRKASRPCLKPTSSTTVKMLYNRSNQTPTQQRDCVFRCEGTRRDKDTCRQAAQTHTHIYIYIYIYIHIYTNVQSEERWKSGERPAGDRTNVVLAQPSVMET
jgi:hypothetical protein